VHAFPKYSTDVLCTLTVQLAGYTHTQRVSDVIVAIIYTRVTTHPLVSGSSVE